MKTITVQELKFAGDMVLIADLEKTLQQNLKIYQEELKKVDMEISTNKINTMIIAAEEQKHNIMIEGRILEQVKSYKYLETIIEENGKIEKEINERIRKSTKIYNALRNTFLDKKEIPKQIKTEVFKKVIRPTLTYGSESWTTTNESKVTAIEMRFLRRIEGITRKDMDWGTISGQQNIKVVETVIEER